MPARISCGGNLSAGCLAELSFIANHDAYLSINPQGSLFKQVWRRITNFAKGEADLGFNGSVGFGKCLTGTVPRNGDALGETYLSGYLSPLSLTTIAANQKTVIGNNIVTTVGQPYTPGHLDLKWTNGVAYAMIKRFFFFIGGQQIDEFDKHMLMCLEEHNAFNDRSAQGEQIGHFDADATQRDWAARGRYFYAKLPVYWSEFRDLNLPLIALQYHEVTFQVELEELAQCVVGTYTWPNAPVPVGDPSPATLHQDAIVGQLLDLNLMVMYYYYDTMERRICAQQPHENLITGHMYHRNESVATGSPTKRFDVNFNFPTVSLYWFFQEDEKTKYPYNQHFNYGVQEIDLLPGRQSTRPTDPFSSVQLNFNGNPRTGPRESVFYRTVSPQMVHPSMPIHYLYSYHFCAGRNSAYQLNKPLGSCNMSRIDKQSWTFGLSTSDISGSSLITKTGSIQIMSTHFNIAKIAGGMYGRRHSS